MNRIIRRVLPAIAFAWIGFASAGPITDTVTVDGTEWAQVDLFLGLTWSDINVVCPAGVCGSGTLNGFDMVGWSLASIDNMNTLFNHYIGFAALGPGPDYYAGAINTFADAFFADGWRPTSKLAGSSKIAEGWVDDALYLPRMFAYRDARAFCNGFGVCQPDEDRADTSSLSVYGGDPFSRRGPGAWFVRTSTLAPVPVPATLALFGLALATLGLNRLTRKLHS